MEATTFNFLNTIMTNNSPEQKVGIAESPKRQMPPWERSSLIRSTVAELAMVQRWKESVEQRTGDLSSDECQKIDSVTAAFEYRLGQLQDHLRLLLDNPKADFAIWINIGRPVVICSVADEIEVRELQSIDHYIEELDDQVAAEDLNFSQ